MRGEGVVKGLESVCLEDGLFRGVGAAGEDAERGKGGYALADAELEVVADRADRDAEGGGVSFLVGGEERPGRADVGGEPKGDRGEALVCQEKDKVGLEGELEEKDQVAEPGKLGDRGPVGGKPPCLALDVRHGIRVDGASVDATRDGRDGKRLAGCCQERGDKLEGGVLFLDLELGHVHHAAKHGRALLGDGLPIKEGFGRGRLWRVDVGEDGRAECEGVWAVEEGGGRDGGQGFRVKGEEPEDDRVGPVGPVGPVVVSGVSVEERGEDVWGSVGGVHADDGVVDDEEAGHGEGAGGVERAVWGERPGAGHVLEGKGRDGLEGCVLGGRGEGRVDGPWGRVDGVWVGRVVRGGGRREGEPGGDGVLDGGGDLKDGQRVGAV